jgi:hypothetical protein
VATLPEHAWERARHRAKIIEPLAQWRPFGVLTLAVQMQVLEAATTAIALIKSRTLFPRSVLPIACPKKSQNLNPSPLATGGLDHRSTAQSGYHTFAVRAGVLRIA